jgi:hypothetical protein
MQIEFSFPTHKLPPIPEAQVCTATPEMVEAEFKTALQLLPQYKHYFQPEIEEDLILLTTRANGDVYNEQAGEIDIKNGRAIKAQFQEKCPSLQIGMEIVDEWVHVEIRKKVKAPVPPQLTKEYFETLFNFLKAVLKDEITSNSRIESGPRFQLPLKNYSNEKAKATIRKIQKTMESELDYVVGNYYIRIGRKTIELYFNE